MKLPESRKKELLTIWYAATLTPRAKRLSKREIAAIDIANVCQALLDETKDPITFPVISALLLGAAKVLRQQSLMIYSDVLHLWSRLQPKLFEPKATDTIDLSTSVAKIKRITLAEHELMNIHTDGDHPFADLYDWTYVSPSFSSLATPSSILDSSSTVSFFSNKSQHQVEEQPSIQNYQQEYEYEDIEDYSFGEEQLNRMENEYILPSLFLEGEHHRREENTDNPSALDMPVFEGQNITTEEQQIASQEFSITDLLMGDDENIYLNDNEDQVLAAAIDDQRRLSSLPPLLHEPLQQRTSYNGQQLSSSVLLEHLADMTSPLRQPDHENGASDIDYFDYGDDGPVVGNEFGFSSPLHISPRTTSRATEDFSGLIPITQENSDDEQENETLSRTGERPRRRRTTTYHRLISDSTTIVSANFYQQQESLVNRTESHLVFTTLTANQRRKNTRRANIERANAMDQLLHRPLVSVEVPRSNRMWQHEFQDAMLTLTSSEIELERARRNQQTYNDDRDSVPSFMDDLLGPLSSTSGVDHHRFQTSRERSGSSELQLWESSDDEEQRRSFLSRTTVNQPPPFSRVPEDDYDYMDDYMDYYSPSDNVRGDEMQENDTDVPDASKMPIHDDGDADDFLSHAQRKIAQEGGDEAVITLETLVSPIAHRSEVARTFYHLLVLASRNKLRLKQENAFGTIQVDFGIPMDMVNAATTSSRRSVENTE